MKSTYLLAAALAATVNAQSTQNLTQALASNPNLSALTQILMGQTSLLRSLSTAQNITVIAPNNQAINQFMNSSGAQAAANPNLLTGVLSYHVLKGVFAADQITTTPAFVPTMLNDPVFTNVTGGQKVEAVKIGDSVLFFGGLKMNSTVTKADTMFNGGIIHEVDTVLTVPMKDSTTALDAGLTSLAGALTQAGLVNALDDMSDVTIFAPTNAAFEAIGSAVGNLTTEQLAGILTYHVINGTVAYSSDLSNGMMVKTLQGEEVKITIQNGSVFVNSAMVVTPDVLVGNGVVHVIDNVLNPSNATATPTTGDPPAFSATTAAGGVPFTSGINPTSTAPLATATATASATSGKQPSKNGATQTGAMSFAALIGLGVAVVMAGFMG